MKRTTSIIMAFGIFCLISLYFQGNAAYCIENKKVKDLTYEEINRNKLLENKIVVARVYPDWQERQFPRGQMPSTFHYENNYKKVRAHIKNNALVFEQSDIPAVEPPNGVMILIYPEDQVDEVVQQYLKNTINCHLYGKEPIYIIPDTGQLSGKPLEVKDALDKKIPSCKVEVFLADQNNPTRISVMSGVTDVNGQIKFPKILWRGFSLNLKWIIKAPGYGSFFVDRWVGYNSLPVINKESEFFDRSIWGTVTGPDGKPVSGAIIRCGSITYPTGAGFPQNMFIDTKMALTDELGGFSLYIPPPENSTMKIIPPNSIYNIVIIPPENSGLSTFNGKVENGRESKMVLQSAGPLRKFVFEDANGPITDVNVLGNIEIIVLTKDTATSMGYYQWRKGQYLPAGKYSILIHPPYYLKLEFEPVEVSDQKSIIFKTKSTKK